MSLARFIIVTTAYLGLLQASTSYAAFCRTVSGTANPYLADPSNTPGNNPFDGTTPPYLAVFSGASIQFFASGELDNNSFPPTGKTPDGGALASSYYGARGGISGWKLPINSLAGIFLGDPIGPAPPPASSNTTFTTLSPALGQVFFFIGDGLTGTGTGIRQTFIAPTGASWIYFASIDGQEWSNNSGEVDVCMLLTAPASVPEPASLAIFGFGVSILAWHSRCRL